MAICWQCVRGSLSLLSFSSRAGGAEAAAHLAGAAGGLGEGGVRGEHVIVENLTALRAAPVVRPSRCGRKRAGIVQVRSVDVMCGCEERANKTTLSVIRVRGGFCSARPKGDAREAVRLIRLRFHFHLAVLTPWKTHGCAFSAVKSTTEMNLLFSSAFLVREANGYHRLSAPANVLPVASLATAGISASLTRKRTRKGAT